MFGIVGSVIGQACIVFFIQNKLALLWLAVKGNGFKQMNLGWFNGHMVSHRQYP